MKTESADYLKETLCVEKPPLEESLHVGLLVWSLAVTSSCPLVSDLPK